MSALRTAGVSGESRELVGLAKGGGFLAGGGLVEFVLRMGIAWILARALGADGYGLYALTVGVSALTVAIGAFGLDDAMVRYVAIQTRAGDVAGARGTIQVGVIGALVAGLTAGGVLFGFAPWIGVDIFDRPDLVPLIRIMAGVVPFLLVSNSLLGVTRGFNRMDYAALGEHVVQSTVRLVLLAILWFVHLDVVVAVVIFGVADLVTTAVYVHFTRRLVRTLGSRVPARRDYTAIFGFAFPLWVSGLLNRFRGRIETFVLGAFAVAADVGIFAVAARVNFLSHMLYRAVVVSVKPVLAQAFAEEDRARLARTYSATTRWTLTMAIPLFLASVLYATQILGVFGTEFTSGAHAFMLLAAGELVLAATGTCGSMIDMAGYTRVKVFNSVLWVVSSIGLSFLLIPPFGLVGAALGSMGALTLINLVRTIEVWIIDRLLPWRIDFWKPVTAAVLAASWGLGLKSVVAVPTFWAAAVQGATVLGVYAALLAVFGIHDDDRIILGRIGRRLRRLVGWGVS